MHTPVVSVIMPAYNAAPYLLEAVNSILSQTLSDLELIIIDDASTDETPALLASVTDPRIQVHKNPENKGIVYSRNRGLALAKGLYLAVLDSDDIALPDRLEKQVRYLEENPGMGACGSHYRVIGNGAKRTTTVKVPVEPADTRTFLYFNVCFCHSTLMMRTALAREYGYREGFDIIEDYEIAYRIAQQWDVGNVDSVTTLYRVHGNNITIGKKINMLEKRQLMDSIVLNDLNIRYTPAQLALHSNFINMNHEYFRLSARLNELETWMVYFYQHLSAVRGINLGMVRRILAVRWFLLCFRTGNYRKAIDNRLLFLFRGDYMMYNLGYMKCLLTRKLEVV